MLNVCQCSFKLKPGESIYDENIKRYSLYNAVFFTINSTIEVLVHRLKTEIERTLGK